MTALSRLGEAPLTVLLDLRHPLAYLALQPAIDFALGCGAAQGIDVDWLPLTVPALREPTAPAADDDRGIRHRRHRACAIAREIEVYGAAQGLTLRDCYRDAPVEEANRAWLWVRGQRPEALPSFLTALFRDYWSLELDAASRDEVAALVADTGADGEGFRAWSAQEGAGAAAVVAEELREYGLFQVPAYVVGDEVFYGRQHLPMIRWILDGRSGPVPI